MPSKSKSAKRKKKEKIDIFRPLRPGEFVQNADGTMSTERTATFEMDDGTAVIFPTIWMTDAGPKFFQDDPDEVIKLARDFEKRTGRRFPRFPSEVEATTFARARSSAGAVFTGTLDKPFGKISKKDQISHSRALFHPDMLETLRGFEEVMEQSNRLREGSSILEKVPSRLHEILKKGPK